MMASKEFQVKYFLTAGETTPQKELPIPVLVNKIIEVATLHANEWGVGYANLVERGEAWVLSRVTIEMKRYPTINEHYSLVTFIEDYNRHFSQRNFEIQGEGGEVIGYARTIWVVINSQTRESVDLSQLDYLKDRVSDHPCPIEKQSRLMPVAEENAYRHTFGFAETDFNRHVNTVRYIELFLNRLPMEKYDSHFIKRFEIGFLKECLYGQEVEVRVSDKNEDVISMDVAVNGQSHCRAKFTFEARN